MTNIMLHEVYAAASEACARCARECEFYASEFAGSIGNTVRLCLDCAQICRTTASFLGRRSHFLAELTRLCAEVCEACALECEKSPDEQLVDCADSCRRCAEQCLKVAEEPLLSGPGGVQGSGVATSVAPAL